MNNSIARSKDIFVFTKDLEGALQNEQIKQSNKPLKALDKISELLQRDSPPDEFIEMANFIKSKIN